MLDAMLYTLKHARRFHEALKVAYNRKQILLKLRNNISGHLWRKKKTKMPHHHYQSTSPSSTMLTVAFKLFVFGFLTTNLHYQDPRILPQATANVDVTFSYPPANAKVDLLLT